MKHVDTITKIGITYYVLPTLSLLCIVISTILTILGISTRDFWFRAGWLVCAICVTHGIYVIAWVIRTQERSEKEVDNILDEALEKLHNLEENDNNE